jgi:transcriptional regulator with XRE-family HTH domain
MTIAADQLKAARELLGWTVANLAAKTGVASLVIANFEAQTGAPSTLQLTVLLKVVEAAGIEFDDEGPVVRLRKEK